jgi:ribosome-interacting GTPase 1
MPANLPPQYYEAEKAFRRARSPAEKLDALQTMLAIMPKHKGTDHLRAELRARMAAVTQQAERQAGGAARIQLYTVRREGAGQVALVGLPNAGKSQLLAALTHATPKIAEYPFTTQLPQPGMMPFENAQVQLVDLPPVVAGATPPWQRALIRQADVLALLIDLSQDPLGDWAALQEELAAMHVLPIAPADAEGGTDDEAGPEGAPGGLPKKALVAGTKLDLAPADSAELLALAVGDKDEGLPLFAVSAATGRGLEDLRRALFAALDVMRVYTKPPGKPADHSRPFTLPRGSTIDDLADAIHHELREKLRYATLWGGSGKFSGQRVGRDHVLEDGDVVELHER